MDKFYKALLGRGKRILILFAIALVVCFVGSKLVAVNYDIMDYLPDKTKSTQSLELMGEEFAGGIPNARVMVRDITIPQAMEYKEKLKEISGVTAVTWLDDSVDIAMPISSMDQAALENYYKDNTALMSVTIADGYLLTAVEEIRDLVGEGGAVTGIAVSTADATSKTVKEITKITAIAVVFAALVLVLTTTSWVEPIVVLLGLGVAIMLNKGTNLLFGEVSFVTNAAGSVLLLAVSLDYSVFLLHRFHECKQSHADPKDAMLEALLKSTSSILSSGLTTVIGFLALVIMQFRIGADLGIALAKGVVISLITVFVFMPALILFTYKWIEKTTHKPLLPSFKALGKAAFRVAIPLVCLFAILIVPAYLGSNANSYLYGASEIFKEGTQFGKDKVAIEQVFGRTDTYVLMVPKGNTAVETQLSEELQQIPQITSIISYVDMAGAEIPNAYLDEATLAQLEGENYSRMVLSVDVPYEGKATFDLVEQIREIAQKYYPEDNYLAGNGVSSYDLKATITADMVFVNLVAIGAVLIVLLITMKSITLPFILVLSIEMAIWVNLTIPYFADQPVYYLAYLIVSSVQLGATVDYAILQTNRYRENRQTMEKKLAVMQTVSDTFVSIMTSGSVMTAVGFLMGWISSNQLLAQLGIFIGRGAIFSLAIVVFVLPGLLYLCDKWILEKGKVTEQ